MKVSITKGDTWPPHGSENGKPGESGGLGRPMTHQWKMGAGGFGELPDFSLLVGMGV